MRCQRYTRRTSGNTHTWHVRLHWRPWDPALPKGPQERKGSLVVAGSVWSWRLSRSPLPQGEGFQWTFENWAEGIFRRLVLRGPFLSSWKSHRKRGLRSWDFSRVPDVARSVAPCDCSASQHNPCIFLTRETFSFRSALVKSRLVLRKFDVVNVGGEIEDQ